MLLHFWPDTNRDQLLTSGDNCDSMHGTHHDGGVVDHWRRFQMTLSPYDIRQLADTVTAFGRTWGTGYLNRLVTQGQITQDDADRVLRHADFRPPMPTEWGVSA